ncbi:hypothetical protein Acr_11g0010470 [Actinidia rufa]|uniref:PMI1/PMIR1-2 C-terminal domain-containing protein n=1 Tax=Actinidia rufa TaxID=165716 RepID=A0A7J0FDH9_9ERIC|nr:hypothetical protein Acr_11g0010470 [Actinidia rufa]
MGDNRLESGRTINIPKLVNESKQSTRDHTVDIGRDSGSGMLRGSELGRSITFLYQKLDDPKLGGSQEFDSYREHVEPFKPKHSYFPETSSDNIENECLNPEFAVIEQGIELSMKEQWKLEAVDGEMRCDSTDEFYGDLKDHFVMENGRCEGNGIGEIEGFESVEYNLSVSESGDFDSSLDINEFFKQETYTENQSSYKAGKMVKSLSLDDLTESVANDFLKMVVVEQIPLDLSADKDEPVDFSVADLTAECGDLSDNFDLPLLIRAAEEDEDPEMVEFSADDFWWIWKSDLSSPSRATECPPLGEGLGPIVQTKDGVVLPVAMGSSIMEILQHWASVGFETMSLEVNKLMPMEDINGNMMQQVACVLQQEDEQISIDSDYVSLEDLAPLAMDKIEALSIEGLRIQSGMSDEEAPSRIRPQSIGKTSAFLDRSATIGGPSIWEGAAELQLLGVNDHCDDDDVDVEELISLSITLDEWMRLDVGAFGDEEEIGERTSKILAAHVAENIDFISRMLTRGSKWDKPTGRSCGLLGNNFTVALRVQLRGPLRDYETVGVPMLALVQEIVDGVNAEENWEKRIEEGIPWFKITEVHLVGFNTEPGKTQQWGATTQEQSGTRWLLAIGMAWGYRVEHLLSCSWSES